MFRSQTNTRFYRNQGSNVGNRLSRTKPSANLFYSMHEMQFFAIVKFFEIPWGGERS